MSVRALILDVDGVLVPPLRFAQYLQREHPSIACQMGEFFSGVFRDCIVGKANLREVLPPYLEQWGWPYSLDDFINRWFDEENEVDERLIEVVRTVRGLGVTCCVATNQERHRVEYMRSQMGFDEYFDEVFDSASIGFRKPDLDFYDAVSGKLGLRGEDILYWDDTQANVEAAVLCGWNAKLYTNLESFVDETERALRLDGLRASK